MEAAPEQGGATSAAIHSREERHCPVCGRTQTKDVHGRKPVCRECRILDARAAREGAFLFHCLFGQSNISRDNRQTLRLLRHSPAPGIAEDAELVLEIAALNPRARGRWGWIAQRRPELLQRAFARFGPPPELPTSLLPDSEQYCTLEQDWRAEEPEDRWDRELAQWWHSEDD